MTTTTITTTNTASRVPGVLGRVSGWIGSKQRQLSDRVHAEGDAFCACAGLTVTKNTGRYGFGARTYRHPGFDRAGREA